MDSISSHDGGCSPEHVCDALHLVAQHSSALHVVRKGPSRFWPFIAAAAPKEHPLQTQARRVLELGQSLRDFGVLRRLPAASTAHWSAVRCSCCLQSTRRYVYSCY